MTAPASDLGSGPIAGGWAIREYWRVEGALRAVSVRHTRTGRTCYGITGDVALGWLDWPPHGARDALRGDRRTSSTYMVESVSVLPALVATFRGAAYMAYDGLRSTGLLLTNEPPFLPPNER